MTESLVIAAILAICAVILWLRPQSISTLSGNPEENPELNWRAVRRIGAGGLLLLAVVIGGGSWLLLRAGVEPQTITVLGILLLFIGAIQRTSSPVTSCRRPVSRTCRPLVWIHCGIFVAPCAFPSMPWVALRRKRCPNCRVSPLPASVS